MNKHECVKHLKCTSQFNCFIVGLLSFHHTCIYAWSGWPRGQSQPKN